MLPASTPKPNFELSHLPPLLSRSPWTIYLDDVPDLDTQGRTCTEKYLGSSFHPSTSLSSSSSPLSSPKEIALLNVRPDGYVGSIRKWNLAGPTTTTTTTTTDDTDQQMTTDGQEEPANNNSFTNPRAEQIGREAAAWLDDYFGGFLAVPSG